MEDPAYLKDLIRILDASLAENLDFTRAERINRSFIPADLHKCESDLIFKVPYQVGEGEVLVYVLLEQQTEPDTLMSFRIYRYCGELWSVQVREWEDANQPAENRHLHPVIPIVFYTGRDRWDEEIALVNLMDLPDSLRRFVPSWETLFLDLHQTPAEVLTQFSSALGWALRVLQVERAPMQEMERVLREAMAGIEGLSVEQSGQWLRCAWFLLQLVFHRRSRSEVPGLMRLVVEEASRSKFHEDQEEVEMQSYAEYLTEQGETKGLARGRVEGEISGERRTLVRQGTSRFGPPDAASLTKLESIQSLEVLDQLALRILEANSWEEMLRDL